IKNGDDAAFVGHAAFDAFGNELVGVVGRVLKVTVGRAVGHGAYAAHAAIRLIRTTLKQHHIAGRFFGAGEHAAHHAGGSTRRQGLGNVARVADAAVGN